MMKQYFHSPKNTNHLKKVLVTFLVVSLLIMWATILYFRENELN